MQKRSYTKLDSIKNEILEMRASGWSNSEVADYFGLKVRQIKNLINRHNRREKQLAQGILPKPKGRPRKETPEAELERLRMENKLLRDFLQFIGRK